MSTTAQKMSEILDRVKSISDEQDRQYKILHLLLRLQDTEEEKIDELLAAHDNDEEWKKLIATLRSPTKALEKAVKKNQ